MNRNKGKIIIVVFLCVCIISLSIGFAVLGSDLEISGIADVKTSSWDIHFKNLSSVTKVGMAEEITHPTIKENNGVASTLIGDYSVSLKAPKDYIYYTFDIVNEGDYDAKIGFINIPTPKCSGSGSNATNDAANVCNNLTYTLTYTDTLQSLSLNDTLKKGETKNVKLKLTYGDVTALELPKGDVTISNLQVSINYVQSGSSSSSSGGTTSLVYNDGDIVYYDVLNGTTCTNYHEDNSKTNYNGTTDKKTTDNQNSCLKFYAFNYDEGDTTVNLLLDHNTTALVYWTESGNSSNENGPINVINQLKTDTSSWVGTITPANYTVSQTSGGNYTIDYSDYKARLITANEVAEITGNTSFNESTSTSRNWFYFDTNTTSASSTCKSGDTSGCSYGWLYDRTSRGCTEFGCLNNSDAIVNGYWTSTSIFGSSSHAWFVYNGGLLNTEDPVYLDNNGVRPVITIYKSNL